MDYGQTTREENIPIAPLQEKQRTQLSADTEGDPGENRALSVFMAAVFLFGEMAGTGIVAVPNAVESSGIPGIVYLCFTILVVTFTGKLIVESWELVRKTVPEYGGHVRFPYPAIGQVTYGRAGRLVVSGLLIGMQYGCLLVMLILVTDNLGQLMDFFVLKVPFHYRCLMVAAAFVPLFLFGRPKDFWFLGLLGALTPLISVVLIFTEIMCDYASSAHKSVEHVTPTFQSSTMALGILCFAFAGHPVFPTIHTDVKDGTRFIYAVFASIWGLAGCIVLLSLSAYFVYGSDTMESILMNMSPGPLLYIVQTLMTAHFLMAGTIAINPVFQEMEDVLHVSKEFNWKRCVVRITMLMCAVVIAVLVPHFPLVISLVGGSSAIGLTVICPPVFHYKLSKMYETTQYVQIPFWRKMLYVLTIAHGLISGILITYSAIFKLATLGDTKPTKLLNSTDTY